MLKIIKYHIFLFLYFYSICYSDKINVKLNISEIKLATVEEFKGPYKQSAIEFLQNIVRPKVQKEMKKGRRKEISQGNREKKKPYYIPIRERDKPNVCYANSPNNAKVYSGKWCTSYKDLEIINHQKKRGLFCIKKNEKDYFRFETLWTVTDNIVKSFYVSNNEYVIETENQVFLDKKSMNNKMEASETFYPRHFFKKQLFLATKKGKSYIVYDFKIYGKGYDYIFRYGCCEPSVMNPKTKDNGISFYAKNEGNWILVTVEIKNESLK